MTTLNEREFALLNQINIIAFDLDDTLWPCMPTIRYAEGVLHRWLEQNYPRITDSHSPDEMVVQREQLILQNEKLAADVSSLRCELLKHLARKADYDPQNVSEAGFEVFYEARQQVSFYEDVLPCLERLQSRYRLGVISNGNANIDRVGLGHLIEHSVHASELKIAKPHRLIFETLVEKFEVAANEVLYVGDHPEFDVAGPQNAGLQAVWMNRDNNIWPGHLPEPGYQVSNLYELELLLQSPSPDRLLVD